MQKGASNKTVVQIHIDVFQNGNNWKSWLLGLVALPLAALAAHTNSGGATNVLVGYATRLADRWSGWPNSEC